jgi:hypothetical protein
MYRLSGRRAAADRCLSTLDSGSAPRASQGAVEAIHAVGAKVRAISVERGLFLSRGDDLLVLGCEWRQCWHPHQVHRDVSCGIENDITSRVTGCKIRRSPLSQPTEWEHVGN